MKKFALPAESVERVKAAAAAIQTKYGITNRAATKEDFDRICADEEIKVGVQPKISVSLCFTFTIKNEPQRCIIFRSSKARIKTKFFFIGALFIPSMHNFKKLFNKEIPKIELKTKDAEADLFAALMLEPGAR